MNRRHNRLRKNWNALMRRDSIRERSGERLVKCVITDESHHFREVEPFTSPVKFIVPSSLAPPVAVAQANFDDALASGDADRASAILRNVTQADEESIASAVESAIANGERINLVAQSGPGIITTDGEVLLLDKEQEPGAVARELEEIGKMLP